MDLTVSTQRPSSLPDASGGYPNYCRMETHGVPLILKTLNWVPSKITCLKVSPVNRDETPNCDLLSLCESLSCRVGVVDVDDRGGGWGKNGALGLEIV